MNIFLNVVTTVSTRGICSANNNFEDIISKPEKSLSVSSIKKKSSELRPSFIFVKLTKLFGNCFFQ